MVSFDAFGARKKPTRFGLQRHPLSADFCSLKESQLGRAIRSVANHAGGAGEGRIAFLVGDRLDIAKDDIVRGWGLHPIDPVDHFRALRQLPGILLDVRHREIGYRL